MEVSIAIGSAGGAVVFLQKLQAKLRSLFAHFLFGTAKKACRFVKRQAVASTKPQIPELLRRPVLLSDWPPTTL